MTAVPHIPEAQDPETIRGVLEPTGFRILVRIYNLQGQMKNWGNLIMPEERRVAEEIAQVTAQVVELGPDAYRDPNRFPTGAWCKVGDFIVMRPYAGTRFVIGENRKLYALINDDSVLGVVRGDPTDIERS